MGKVKNTGLVEIPLGIPLKEMIFDIGGGILDDKPSRPSRPAALPGAAYPASLLETPVDYESLCPLGSIMGSGGMIVMDEGTCMVDLAKYFIDFTMDESCGKCTPCREGTLRLGEMLEAITAGKGTEEDLDKLVKMSELIKKTSLCGLGQTAPQPGAVHHPLFQGRISGPHPGGQMPGQGLQASHHLSHFGGRLHRLPAVPPEVPDRGGPGLPKKSRTRLSRRNASSAAPVTKAVNSTPSWSSSIWLKAL